ncbi:signal peptidase I [Protaetiibacter larvae]|uniref:Signal peptidase I n=1 Tax=Protaetiibacter larvae TaxID=2592654 RepID=A0A5C1Y9K8_9MICO|nr:signal peptidase I [Protaetiibacter larvae]QEO10571.1 signal peptidase I [Protaetiibacter larvae]
MSDDTDAPETVTADSTVPEEAEPTSRNAKKRREEVSRKRSFGLFLRDVALIIVAAVVISFLIKTFLIRSFYIPSESMEDTLLKNDRIIVNQLEPKLMPIQRGDVIVFQDPGGWLDPVPPVEQNPVAGFFDWLLSIVGLTAPDSNDHLIKRVIGLPGDTVACCNDFGQMTVNGVPLDESAYVKLGPGVTKVSRDDFEVTVPADSLWVMGDNRYNSQDSRYNRDKPGNGFVPIDHVVGRAILITWPVSRWTWLDNYPTTFADVPDPTTPAVENSGAPALEPSTTDTSGG